LVPENPHKSVVYLPTTGTLKLRKYYISSCQFKSFLSFLDQFKGPLALGTHPLTTVLTMDPSSEVL
jgi:hypothetical protein